MIERKLISIIIPVYKVEKYLHKCVDSVINQTYKNLEIILVDDGSPDNCPAICDEYAKKDKRIKVIHKANGGLSSARNAGLDIMKGDYVYFLDSDDYIDAKTIDILYIKLVNEKADIVFAAFQKVDEKYNKLTTTHNEMAFTYNNSNKFSVIKDLYPNSVISCNKLINKEVFNNLRFLEGKIHEDEFIIHHLIDNSKKIIYLPQSLYFYLQRAESIMGNKYFNQKKLHAVEAFKDRITLFIERKVSKIDLGFVYSQLLALLINGYYKTPRKSELQKIVLKEFNSIDLKEVYNLIPLKTKLKVFMFKHFRCLYGLLYKIKQKLKRNKKKRI